MERLTRSQGRVTFGLALLLLAVPATSAIVVAFERLFETDLGQVAVLADQGRYLLFRLPAAVFGAPWFTLEPPIRPAEPAGWLVTILGYLLLVLVIGRLVGSRRRGVA